MSGLEDVAAEPQCLGHPSLTFFSDTDLRPEALLLGILREKLFMLSTDRGWSMIDQMVKLFEWHGNLITRGRPSLHRTHGTVRGHGEAIYY